VAGDDEADVRGAQGLDEVQVFFARHTKDVPYPLILEAPDEEITRFHGLPHENVLPQFYAMGGGDATRGKRARHGSTTLGEYRPIPTLRRWYLRDDGSRADPGIAGGAWSDPCTRNTGQTNPAEKGKGSGVLIVNRLRDLDLIAPSPGRPAHASAASGLVQMGDYMHVLLDDEAHLASFRLGDPGPGRTWRMLDDALPLDAPARKAVKPDLEVLLALSPGDRYGQTELLALGSGSTASRERAVRLKLGADGAIVSASAPIDLALVSRAARSGR